MGPGAGLIRPLLLGLVSPFFVLAVFAGATAFSLNSKLADAHHDLATLHEEIEAKGFIDSLHGATFAEFGMPPRPYRPPIPRSLASTYYRGNDERDPALVNGGYYRTATFELSLETEDGTRVHVGDSVSGERLFVHYDIRRARFTPDFFFDEKMMRRMYLTVSADLLQGYEAPVKDRVDLTTREPLHHWDVRYPVGVAPAISGKLKGLIYVCETRSFNKVVIGGRFHYGIEYEVVLDGGKIAFESDLWMGALYRSRDSPFWKLPLKEWFHHEPIPELDRPNTSDPVLLGIDDYTKRDEAGAPTPVRVSKSH